MSATCEGHSEELIGTEIHAWRFVAGALAWYSTLSCISLHPPSPVPLDLLWCETGHISPYQIMGCQDWVMVKIREIATLCRWKDDMQAKRVLSLRDLALRAAELEKSLEAGLVALDADIAAVQPDNDLLLAIEPYDYGSARVHLLVTYIFASAALTYLFTIVSGANPNLSEIQGSVTKTISKIRQLPHLKFLGNLSWPLCITGCLSIGQNRDIFYNLIRKYNSKPHDFGSSQHIQSIVEKSWVLSEESCSKSNFIDWKVAMEVLDLDILLI